MATLAILGALLLTAASPPHEATTAADAVTLRDGSSVLGQVVEPAPRGKMLMIVRRAWAEENLPDRAEDWEAAEAAQLKRARAQRLERLRRWSDERQSDADDPIRRWLDAEINRLESGPDDASPLMVVALDRGEVKSVARRPKEVARMLRQGWIGRLADVESMAPDDLKSALAGRGFAQSGVDAAPVDRLLPTPVESDRRWLARRAATEVAHEPALRLIRYHNLVLPEGQEPDEADLKRALEGLTAALSGDARDPLLDRARKEEKRGRVGLTVTRMDRAEDLSSVTVETTLWVRTAPDHWEPAVRRAATVRTADVKEDEVAPLAGNEQVQAVFRTIEGLGLGQVPRELKERSLLIGAATRQALGRSKEAIGKDLEDLALDVTPPKESGPAK